MLMCCCAKKRNDEDSSIGGIETKQKSNKRIELEFIRTESSIGLKDIDLIELAEKILFIANNEVVNKKELI